MINCHHLSWLSLLPASCPPSHLTEEGGTLGNGESLEAGTNQQKSEHWCVTDTVPVTKPKHSTLGAAMTEAKVHSCETIMLAYSTVLYPSPPVSDSAVHVLISLSVIVTAVLHLEMYTLLLQSFLYC